MNFFKKLFQKIDGSFGEKSTSVSNENEETENFENSSPIDPEEIPSVEEEIEEIKPKVKAEKPKNESYNNSDEKIKSAIDLEEFTISKIILDSPLAFSGVKLSGISIHFRNGRTAPEVVAGQKIFENNTQFLKKLQRELSNHGIGYTDNLKIKLIYNSQSIDQVAQINKNIGIEVFTPQQTAEKFIGKIIVHEGYAWEKEYILEPIPDKIYNVGRGENPKLDNALRVRNDIAFISLDEIKEEKYKINNFVSRSILQIFYDENNNEFILKKSGFLGNNMKHKIKIFSTTISGFKETDLSHESMNYSLQNGDQIMLNDQIMLEFLKVKK